MKVALCLSGIVGGTNGKNGRGDDIDFALCSDCYKEYVIEPNNCDVFLHSWSVEHEERLIDLYKPKSWIFEPQIDFYAGLDEEIVEKARQNKHRFQSKWYSVVQSLLLMKEYGKYDCVIISRFDLMFLETLDISKFNLNYIYTPGYAGTRENPGYKYALGDLFFISSYNNIMKLVLNKPKRWFYDSGPNPHKAIFARVENVFDSARRILKVYGWTGYEWELYRKRICKRKQ